MVHQQIHVLKLMLDQNKIVNLKQEVYKNLLVKNHEIGTLI